MTVLLMRARLRSNKHVKMRVDAHKERKNGVYMGRRGLWLHGGCGLYAGVSSRA